MNSPEKLQVLFQKYILDTASNEEKAELAQLIELADNDTISGLLKHSWETQADTIPVFTSEESAVVLRSIMNKKPEQAPVVPIFRKQWFRIAAAAVLLIGALAVYNLVGKNSKNDRKPEIVKTNSEKPDIAPGGNKAVLTLADGSQIVLDNAANGNLANQGNVKVIKLDGQLAYNSAGSTTEVLYNTITTPRGGQYQLVLADGSKVWLNAASSLRFPATFVGKERKVELTGEGYFEVAKNGAMPFKVNVTGKGEVEVLGTHFNINSYTDEATINTTLLEGKVKVTATATDSRLSTPDSRLLSPGQQAQLNPNGQISLNKNPNLGQVMAWKNGVFNFDNSDLQMVLRQLSRWYDVEIRFEGAVPQKNFEGEMQRDLKLSQVLRILEKNNVRFRIEGKTLIVLK